MHTDYSSTEILKVISIGLKLTVEIFSLSPIPNGILTRIKLNYDFRISNKTLISMKFKSTYFIK